MECIFWCGDFGRIYKLAIMRCDGCVYRHNNSYFFDGYRMQCYRDSDGESRTILYNRNRCYMQRQQPYIKRANGRGMELLRSRCSRHQRCSNRVRQWCG